MKSIAKLVTFGNGGDTVYYHKWETLTGYGTPERPHAADPTRENQEFPDGIPVIDNREAVDTPEGYKWVFDGPLVNVDLPDGDRCAMPKPSDVMVAAVADNEYGNLLALQSAHQKVSNSPGPLDTVSISEYVAGWRAVGARIGRYYQNQIIWEGEKS